MPNFTGLSSVFYAPVAYNTFVYYVENDPILKQAKEEGKRQVVRVNLRLRAENNSKFVRGKTKARQEIERYYLHYYMTFGC